MLNACGAAVSRFAAQVVATVSRAGHGFASGISFAMPFSIWTPLMIPRPTRSTKQFRAEYSEAQ
jgi:hypothetical protein